MWGKVLVISLVLIIVFSLAACREEVAKEVGGVNEVGVANEVGLPAAQEVVNGASNSLNDARTFQLDMDMNINMSSEVDGEAFEIAMVMVSNAKVDIENRRLGMDATIDMMIPEEDEMEMGMEVYLINDQAYIGMMGVPEIGTMWLKSEMPVEYWEQMSQTESQIDLLKTGDVEVIGSEVIGGIDCYVLQLTPDLGQLWQIAMQQAAIGGEEILPDVAEDFFQEMFRSFSVRQWIAKDTYYLIKAEMNMGIESTSETMGLSEEMGEFIMVMDIAMELLVYDYNQPVSIVLPPEAEDAVVDMFVS